LLLFISSLILNSMSTVLEFPATEWTATDFHAFNVAVWDKLSADPSIAALDFRIETDRHGQILASPLASPLHGSRQVTTGSLLHHWHPLGRVISECPVSTSEGVKAIDVAWCSAEIWERFKDQSCFLKCPEICVEICSPSNTRSELEEKKRLYFAAGAREVWFCERDGSMRFFLAPESEPVAGSALVPAFPGRIA
jgi:Uma2 family endonuclease